MDGSELGPFAAVPVRRNAYDVCGWTARAGQAGVVHKNLAARWWAGSRSVARDRRERYQFTGCAHRRPEFFDVNPRAPLLQLISPPQIPAFACVPSKA